MARKQIVLSIDGGGIRGIVPGQILTHVERLLKEIFEDSTYKIADHFDLVAGTSTGGILGIAYLMPEFGRPMYTAEEVVDIYFERGDDIFDVPFYHKLKTAGGLLDEKYPDEGLEEALADYFGEVRLNELLKPTLFTAYDIKRRKAHFFTQHDAENPAKNFLVKDIARATAAAPTYFEPARIKSDDNKYYPLIDGGIFANNPAMCAFAEVRSKFSSKEKKVTAADMKILSIGTGYAKKAYHYNDAKDWGAARWVKPAIDFMMSGVSETVDYELQQIFAAAGKPDQYLRINGALPAAVSPDMDCVEPDNLNALKDFGDELFDANKEAVLKFLKSP
jgi:patatin-like phospholipase/acyl hydrolase